MSLRQEQWMKVGVEFEQRENTSPYGLCEMINGVAENDRHFAIIDSLLSSTDRRFSDSSYWLNFTREDFLLRATFAYLMAAMTDEERDDIVEGL